MIPDPSIAQLEQQLAAANDERRALKLAVFNGDEAKMSSFSTEQILQLIACYREDTEIMDAWHEAEDEVGLLALRERLQAKEQRIAQLEQEQATLRLEYANSNRVIVRLMTENSRAEAALGETRQALHQLTEKYDALLSRVDTTGNSDALVPQPPVGDTSTDRERRKRNFL